MANQEFKPCPFCGCTKNDTTFTLFTNRDEDGVWVECEYCDTRGPKAYFGLKVGNKNAEAQARDLWNERNF